MAASSARNGRCSAAPKERVLVVDVGNSKIAYGLFLGDRLRHHGTIPLAPRTARAARRALELRLRRHRVAPEGLATALACVVPRLVTPWSRGLAALTGQRPLVLGADRIPGFRLRVPEPRQVGADRLANALGVVAAHGAPAIVVDLGTATNFEVVNRRGDFLGGAIAPGLATAADGLWARAARLHPVPLRAPRRALGTTTAEALRAGLVLGHAGLVDALVRRLAHGLGRAVRVVATGGLASLVAPHSETIQTVDPFLTLRGLREAYARRHGAPARRR